MSAAPSQRYDRFAMLLHWIIGIALLCQIAFGWLLGEFARGTPEKALAVNLHKSSGLVLAALILVRLYWRLRRRPPDYPGTTSPASRRAIRAGHALLYVCMVGMPLTGYLASNFSRHGISFFNVLALPPWGPDDRGLYRLFNGAHDLLAVAFTALVAGHLVFAAYHAYIARDGLAARMAPGA
jgi:cytochrome b561